MYHIICDETLASLRNNAPQKIRIAVNTANESFELTQSNLTQGSCSVDRYCCSGERIEIGSAIAAELKLTLKNAVITYNGQEYNPADITFEGAEMRPFCLVPSVNGSYEEIPLGVFTVDEPPRKLSTITIKALDSMMRFDVAHDGAVGTSLLVVVQHCCDLAGVTLSSSAITFLNGFAGVYTLPETIADKEDLVCRQVLMWVGEMTASCAYIDENGYLDFKQYPQTHLGAMVITEADRYSSDMQESDITITGITVTPTDSESEAVTIGAQGYEWNIEGNQLLVSPDEMASAPLGYSDKKFFAYRPFTASTKSFPHLWPMDAIVFSKTTNGVTEVHNSVITHHTWKLNGSSSISAVGKTATKNGYATHGGFTAKQKAVLERAVKGQVKTQISGYQQAILDINEVAQRATGLYNTTDEDTGITYYHNQPDIADSTYIYMETSAGRFMATGPNAWNDGNPVWTNAWTSMGQIVAHSMAAGTITTDLLSVGSAANPTYNLMTAGDFYDKTGGSGWSKYYFQSAAYDISSEVGFSAPVGRDFMRLRVGTATETYCFVKNKYKINVQENQKYTASFYSRRDSSDDARYSRLVVKWYNSNNQELTTSTVAVNDYSSTEWVRFHGAVTAPPNSKEAEITFYVDNTNTYDESCIYIAGFMFEKGSVLHDWDNGEIPNSSNVIIDKTGIDIYNGAIRVFDESGNVVFSQSPTGALSFTGEMTAKFKNSSGQDTAYLKITNEDYANQDYATAAIKIFDNTNSLFARIEAYKATYTDTNSNSTVVFPTLEIAAIGANSTLGLSAGDYGISIDSTGISHTGPTTLLNGLYIPRGQNINIGNVLFLTTQTSTNCFYIGNSNWDIHSKAKKNYFDNDIVVDGISFKEIANKVL